LILFAINARPATIKLASDIVSSITLIAGVAIGWGRRGLLTIAIAVAIPTIIFRWTAWAYSGSFSQVWNEARTIADILVVGYILLAPVFRASPINPVRVQGAVAAYLLLGVADGTKGPMTSVVDWIYYGFCTLRTLGYGDIIPTGPTSRMLAIGEAISGQLFLAILVARLAPCKLAQRAHLKALLSEGPLILKCFGLQSSGRAAKPSYTCQQIPF
jgi:hypothetical protein